MSENNLLRDNFEYDLIINTNISFFLQHCQHEKYCSSILFFFRKTAYFYQYLKRTLTSVSYSYITVQNTYFL